MAKFSVIIPAAGKSERFGAQGKKTFAKLDGRAVFLRTLEHFVNRDDVCQTILVINPEDREDVKQKFGANLAFMGVKLTDGGPRRCDTVALALKEVADEADYVAVHDAARPCVTTEMIDAVFAEATKSGAAILACPLSGTIKRVSEAGVIEGTLDRTELFEAQTPQVFKKALLTEACEKIGEAGDSITDDAQMVELTGHPVAVVRSDSTNLKITTKADLALAASIIKTRPSKPVQRFGAFEEAQW